MKKTDKKNEFQEVRSIADGVTAMRVLF